MTEQGYTSELSKLSDKELIRMFPDEFSLMGKTDPEVLEKDVVRLTAKMPEKDREFVTRAIEFIKPLYTDTEGKYKERRYSETASILHPYRLALAADTSNGYKIATMLLHDVTENFGVTSGQILELYKDIDAADEKWLITQGIDAFTRRKPKGVKEDYNIYVQRLKDMATKTDGLSYLVGAKVADMVQNSLDPGALPGDIRRKPYDGMAGRITNMLGRYMDGGAILLSTRGNSFRRLAAANELGKRTLTKPNYALVA